MVLYFILYSIFNTENEKENRMSFLEVEIIGEPGKFTDYVDRKLTFNGFHTHFDRFL